MHEALVIAVRLGEVVEEELLMGKHCEVSLLANLSKYIHILDGLPAVRRFLAFPIAVSSPPGAAGMGPISSSLSSTSAGGISGDPSAGAWPFEGPSCLSSLARLPSAEEVDASPSDISWCVIAKGS